MLKINELLICTSLIFFCSEIFACKLPYNKTVHTECSTNNTEDKLNTNGTCSKVIIRADEFNLTSNSSLFIEKYNLTLNETSYILDNNTAIICKPENSFENPCFCTLSYILAFISLIFQLLIVWILFNVKRYISRGICVFGFTSIYSVGCILAMNSNFMFKNGIIPCSFLALIHFYILAGISWMSMLSTDVVTVVPALLIKLNTLTNLFDICFMWTVTYLGAFMAIFITFIAFSFTISLVLNELFPILHSLLPQCVDSSYFIVINTSCMLFFVSEVIALISMNLAVHYYGRYIFRNTRDDENAKKLKHFRRDHKMIFTFSFIIYVTYIVGALSTIPAISWMWNLFIFLHVSEIGCIFFAALITLMFHLSFPGCAHPAYDILLNFAIVGKLFWKRLPYILKEILREK